MKCWGDRGEILQNLWDIPCATFDKIFERVGSGYASMSQSEQPANDCHRNCVSLEIWRSLKVTLTLDDLVLAYSGKICHFEGFLTS